MSMNNLAVFQNYYSPLVKEEFQKASILRNCVRSDGKIVGTKAYFRKSGAIVANDFNKGADLTYAGTDFGNAVAELQDKVAADLVFDIDKPKFNFDEAKVIAKNVASAIGRCVDQIIIDNALKQTTTSKVGSVSDSLSIDVLLKVLEVFNKNAVPSGDRYILHNSVQLTQLLKNTQIQSTDYNTIKALAAGEVSTFMGFRFINIEDRREGGLPVVSGGSDDGAQIAYAFHKDCVGLAFSKDISNRTDYLPSKMATQISSLVQVGAINIDDKGIVPIHTKASN